MGCTRCRIARLSKHWMNRKIEESAVIWDNCSMVLIIYRLGLDGEIPWNLAVPWIQFRLKIQYHRQTLVPSRAFFRFLSVWWTGSIEINPWSWFDSLSNHFGTRYNSLPSTIFSQSLSICRHNLGPNLEQCFLLLLIILWHERFPDYMWTSMKNLMEEINQKPKKTGQY